MADSFVDYIRRKRGYGGAVSEEEKKAVDTGYNYGGYTSINGGMGGGWGSAAAAQAARIGSNTGYTGGGPTSGPATGSTTGGYTGGGPTGSPTSGSTTGASSGGSAGSSGIGSDYVSGGGPYAGGMYSGGVYAQPRSVPTTTFRVSTGSSYPSSGYGDYGGSNVVRNETPTRPQGLTRAGSGLGDFGGRDTRISGLGDYTGGAVPTSTTGTYSPYAGNTAATGKGAYGTAVHEQLFDAISRAEGTTKYGYNTAYGGGFGAGGKPFTGMTLNQMLDHMAEVRRSGDGNAPMGRFQINAATLKDFANRHNLDLDKTLFDKKTQDMLGLSIAQDKLTRFDGFRKHPDQKARAIKALGAIKNLPAVAPGTVALYKGRAPTAGGIGSDYGASASRGMGSSPGSSYGSGGYKGGTYGGAGGSSINQGVGGAYKNR